MLGLNQRPLPCEGSALPLSYAPRLIWPLHFQATKKKKASTMIVLAVFRSL